VAKLKFSTFLRLLPLTAFFFAIQALAQFEVAPDHFDEDAAKPPAQLVRTKVNQKKVFSSSLDGAQGRSQRRAVSASASAARRAVPSSPSADVPSAKTLPSSAVTTSRRKQRSRPGTVASLRPAAGSLP
jgi:hypothetical protein